MGEGSTQGDSNNFPCVVRYIYSSLAEKNNRRKYKKRKSKSCIRLSKNNPRLPTIIVTGRLKRDFILIRNRLIELRGHGWDVL